MKNAYPEKPVFAYMRTKVTMPEVVLYLQSLKVAKAVKIAAYVMFRMESANGTRGINNNYAGIQADGSRWPAKWDKAIQATVVLNENQTGKQRRFVAFQSWTDSVDMLIDRVVSRGLHVGGTTRLIIKTTVKDQAEWIVAYYREWVTGKAKAIPPPATVNSLNSIYNQGEKIF